MSDKFSLLSNIKIQQLRTDYKIIDVEWLDHKLILSRMFSDKYFENSPEKQKVVNNMLTYYLTHKNKSVYIKTDYLCNKKEKICICNENAEEFRKIYDRKNYKEGDKFISWFSSLPRQK